jgi:phosphohistidine phosphatase
VKLYFLRHGQAGDRQDWRGDDFYRPLTTDGIRRMEREAKRIDDMDLGLDVIITSPLVRAKQTAEIVTKELKMKDRLIEDHTLGLDFDFECLRNVIANHRDKNAIMLVGHEPSMSRTIAQLVGGARLQLKKGGLAYVELASPSSGTGELIWLIPPKVLAG